MSDTPRLSVMVASYNNAPYLEACLASALNQTFPDFEVLVVDDGSTDNSVEIGGRFVRTDERFRVIRLDQNHGISFARQKALQEARGEYVAILDADDVALPARFEKQVKYLDGHPGTVLLGSHCGVIDEEGKRKRVKKAPLHDMEIRWFLTFGNCLHHSTVMYRREPALRCGGYDTELQCGEDMDLLSKLLKSGCASAIPEVLGLWRTHRKSLTHSLRQRELEADYLKVVQRSLQSHLGRSVEMDVVSSLFFNTKSPAKNLDAFSRGTCLLKEACDLFLQRISPCRQEAMAFSRDRAHLRRSILKHLLKICKRNVGEPWWKDGKREWHRCADAVLGSGLLRRYASLKAVLLACTYRTKAHVTSQCQVPANTRD